MKTRIRHIPKKSIQEISQENLHDFYTRIFSFFPTLIWFVITLLCMLIVYLSIIKWKTMIAFIFVFFSSYWVYFIINSLKKSYKDYKFTISSITSDHYSIRNSYNYFQTPKLKSIAQKHIWKDVYSLKYTNIALVTFIFVISTIIISAFSMEHFWVKETSLNIFIFIFLPIILGLIFMVYNKRKFIKKIQNSRHNFFFHSLHAKNYFYSVDENTQWWLNFTFHKKK